MHAPKITPLNTAAILERSGSWFLRSGIQESDGGVSRYHLSDSRRNAAVSTEITGYAVSALLYLAKITDDRQYLEAAERSAQYLVHQAWSEKTATFAYEPDQPYAYFFDCGIVARGLLAIWRATGNAEYFERAKECGLSMAFDFMAGEAMHPVLQLPSKQPVPHGERWSQRPGCYQLKSAVAWHELAMATGHRELASAFERMLAYSLATHASFVPADSTSDDVMDRLHAYAYFLEALLAVPDHAECAAVVGAGIETIGNHLRRMAPRFVRCDVYAQLLRLRLLADRLGLCRLEEAAAEQEALRIVEFQASGANRQTAGAFWFGRKRGQIMPFANPVSTAFAIQALVLWQEYQDGVAGTSVVELI